MRADKALKRTEQVLNDQPDGQAILRHLTAAAKNRRQFRRWLAQATLNRPLSYILGNQPFAGLNLRSDCRALIPRPETEQLFELIVSLTSQPPRTIIDLGTGGGALALALKNHFPDWPVIASDISRAALNLARRNAKNNRLAITFIKSDLWVDIPRQPFDLIVANLPYLPTAEIATLERRIKDFEPHLALDGGADGLAIIGRMLAGAKDYLTPDGQIFLEIHPTHQPKVEKLVKKFLPARTVKFLPDLTGRTRFAIIN